MAKEGIQEPPDTMYVSRNDAMAFAVRTRENLDYVEAARSEGINFHVVTQLINSLLGLLVFLQERNFVEHIEQEDLGGLMEQGWPQIEITRGQEELRTLGRFVYHLRNAVAHGRIRFSSDNPDLKEVTLYFEDVKPRESAPYWCANMKASDLHDFCLKFTELLENTIG